MEKKVLNEIISSKKEISELKKEYNLLKEEEEKESNNRKTDYQLENLTSKGVEFFKKKYKVTILDNVTFKRKTRAYMNKKLASYKANNVPSEIVETQFLAPLFKKYQNTLTKYEEIVII